MLLLTFHHLYTVISVELWCNYLTDSFLQLTVVCISVFTSINIFLITFFVKP